jgi:hypothetical protein
MPDWKPEIRRRLANLQLPPTREAAIIEELAQHLDDCYAELLVGDATTDEAYRAALPFNQIMNSHDRILATTLLGVNAHCGRIHVLRNSV